MMGPFSGAPEDLKCDTVMEKHGEGALYATVKSLMHVIRTEDEQAQQDAPDRIMQILKPWTIRRSLELRFLKEKSLPWILQEIAHLIDLEWTEDLHAKLKALVERYTSCDASVAWRVHRWPLACFSFEIEDVEECDNASGESYN